jgi:hypothetical protein
VVDSVLPLASAAEAQEQMARGAACGKIVLAVA